MNLLGALAALIFAITIPLAYFVFSMYSPQKSHAIETAFLAKSIEKIIQDRPDKWTFESLRLLELISQSSIHREQDEREISTAEGMLVVKTDFTAARPAISISSEFFDSGRLAGSIVVRHSIRTEIMITVLLLILSSFLGCLIYFIFRIYPIRKLNRTLADLQREKDRTEKTLHAIGEGVISVNSDGNIQMINRAAESLVGWDASEAEGLPLEEVYVLRGSSEHQIGRKEYTLTSKRGNEFAVEEIRTYLPEIEPDKNGTVIVFRDLTERRRAEEEKRSLMEALGSLAGGVAHDLNNILGVLVGYSELFLQNIPHENPLRKYAANILKSSEKGAAIIEDLLTLTRRSVTVSKVVNLNQIIADYFETPEFEKLRAYHQHAAIRSGLDKNLYNIRGSSVHLGKTLMNLVSNAAEAISVQGEVTIRTENCYLDKPIRNYDEIQVGNYAVLRISDNGNGISKEDIGKIFEPFYTKKVMGRSGTGLGLAVVWGTVKDHNGYIDVQSEEGKGTVFSLYFPITSDEPEKVRETLSFETYMGRGETILVVDDLEEQRELATNMLERLGYKAAAVSCGEDAVAYLMNETADLIILDMIMDPGIDGLDTYRNILAIQPKQKAIIVSGFSDTERVHTAQSLGARAYLKKPYVIETLGLAVRKELDNSI